jgi:hypothetical protein
MDNIQSKPSKKNINSNDKHKSWNAVDIESEGTKKNSDGQYRRDIRKFFDSGQFNRINAEQWLDSLGYNKNEPEIKEVLDKLFQNDTPYTSSTLFIQDFENLLLNNSEEIADDDSILSNSEINSLLGERDTNLSSEDISNNNNDNDNNDDDLIGGESDEVSHHADTPVARDRIARMLSHDTQGETAKAEDEKNSQANHGINYVMPSYSSDSDNPQGETVKLAHEKNDLVETGYKKINDDVQIEYVKAPNNYKNDALPTDGADYMVFISSSGGHANGTYQPHSSIDEHHMNVHPSLQDRVVGWVGSKDKGMLLIDTRGLSTIPFEGKNETEFARLKVTDGKSLQIDNNAKGGNSSDNSDINGALDPEIVDAGRKSHRRVETQSGSDFSIYAEDEGSYTERINNLSSKATAGFEAGDNSLFVFGTGVSVETGSNTKGIGNGAIAQISVV